jgi:protein-L-isoaspartate(D-aspartate) O-methyltransferase
MTSLAEMNTQIARFNMVEQQIRTWQVLDTQVLARLSQLERQWFVPTAYHALAYSDTEIPIGHGEHMLPPRVDARLLQDLGLQAHEHVLEIGTGTGYLTALLALSCAHVTSLECHADLLAQAQQHLQRADIHNVRLLINQGMPQQLPAASFDAVVLGGSVACVPAELLALLKPAGRLLAVVGDEPMMQTTLVQRQTDGTGHSRVLWDVVIPRLHGFAQTPAFHF